MSKSMVIKSLVTTVLFLRVPVEVSLWGVCSKNRKYCSIKLSVSLNRRAGNARNIWSDNRLLHINLVRGAIRCAYWAGLTTRVVHEWLDILEHHSSVILALGILINVLNFFVIFLKRKKKYIFYIPKYSFHLKVGEYWWIFIALRDETAMDIFRMVLPG